MVVLLLFNAIIDSTPTIVVAAAVVVTLNPREVHRYPELLDLLPRVRRVVRGDHLRVKVVTIQRVPRLPRIFYCVELHERDVVIHLRPPQPPRDEPRERPEQRHDLLLPHPRRDVADEQLRRRGVPRHPPLRVGVGVRVRLGQHQRRRPVPAAPDLEHRGPAPAAAAERGGDGDGRRGRGRRRREGAGDALGAGEGL